MEQVFKPGRHPLIFRFSRDFPVNFASRQRTFFLVTSNFPLLEAMRSIHDRYVF